MRAISQWTPERLAMLGTTRDVVIARKLGMSASSVGDKRRSLGIPRCPTINDPNPRSHRVIWDDSLISRLGRESDTSIALELGVLRDVVGAVRRRLGIQPYKKPRASKEEIKKRNRRACRAWQKANPEKVKAQSHKWYAENKKRHAELSHRWRTENPERFKSTQQTWIAKNRRKVAGYARAYRQRKEAEKFQEGLQQFATLTKKLQTNEKD